MELEGQVLRGLQLRTPNTPPAVINNKIQDLTAITTPTQFTVITFFGSLSPSSASSSPVGSSFKHGKERGQGQNGGPKFTRAFQLSLDVFGGLHLFSGVPSSTQEDPDEDTINSENGLPPLPQQESFIDGFYNEQESILFLHLRGTLDPSINALHSFTKLREQGESFIASWSKLKSNYARALVYLFSLSHILVLCQAGDYFHTSLLQFFKSLDIISQEIKPLVSNVLGKIDGFSKVWIDQGRLCRPIILFSYQIPYHISDSNFINVASSAPVPELELKIKLEESIYYAFRKFGLISASTSELFSIPPDNFVFLARDELEDGKEDCLSSFIHSFCNGGLKEVKPLISSSRAKYDDYHHRGQKERIRFREFILSHVCWMRERELEMRNSKDKSRIVLPKWKDWKRAYSKLQPLLFLGIGMEVLENSESRMNIELEFLEKQWSVAYTKMYAKYVKNLPEVYSIQLHKSRLGEVIRSYKMISRSPEILPWLNKLAQKAELHWKRHQQCETRSLQGSQCTKAIHRVPISSHLEIIPYPDAVMDDSLPETPHSTGTRLISFCNCGKRQGSREEPFTIREANHDFYQRLAKECICDRLESIPFPFFIPSTSSKVSLQEMLSRIQDKRSSIPAENWEKDEEMESDMFRQGYPPDLNLSQNSDSDLDLDFDITGLIGEDEKNRGMSLSDTQDEVQMLFSQPQVADRIPSPPMLKLSSEEEVPTPPEEKGSNEDVKVVEYLPGMLHTRSPPNLLPLIPSWSLLCLGSSSIYDHRSGITHQPGFLSGSNYLLSFHMKIKSEATGISKQYSRTRGKTSKGEYKTNAFNVKVFFGLEYECRNGHRFMLEGPDKQLLIQNGVTPQDMQTLGKKVANSEMPLYFRCPCSVRDATEGFPAQLMRIHVVTPKAPVHVILQPQVQPSPNPFPVFHPGHPGPIKLSPSRYWILRLPYSYVGDFEIFLPPKDLQTENGKILKGLLDVIAMTQKEAKEFELEFQNV